MELITMLLNELEQEALITRKMLDRVPEDKFTWQPHPKSMTMQRLATHVAELPSWVSLAVHTDELDFATGNHTPKLAETKQELLDYFEKSLEKGREDLKSADENLLAKKWVMRNGEEIYYEATKGDLVRVSISQTIHHRAQLGVFLRLNDIAIPGSYGPSADEH